jgi:hypothetical protein
MAVGNRNTPIARKIEPPQQGKVIAIGELLAVGERGERQRGERKPDEHAMGRPVRCSQRICWCRRGGSPGPIAY